MIKRGGYAKKIHYRIGFWPRLKPKTKKITRVWIQAVSVGELSSIQTLLKFLIKDPHFEIVLSGTTSTGQTIAEKKYSNNVLANGPFPLDWLPFSSLCWSRIKPDIALCVDSELWPEHMHQAKRRGIPFCVVNARLSDRSFARLVSLKLFRNLLLPAHLHIFASSQEQQEKWLQLGLNKERTVITGNLKIDIAPHNPITNEERQKFKSSLGFPKSAIVLAGISTWPGEEKFLLQSFQKILEKKIDARLLLIPRHAERRDQVIKTLSSFPFSYQQRTRPGRDNADALVYLADTTGELSQLIKSANLAFLGKTLPPRHEGQNPIEPISIGLPLVIGPKCTNFSEICKEILNRGAVRQGNSISDAQNI